MEGPTTIAGLKAEAEELRARLEEIETLIRLATKYRLADNAPKQVTGQGVLSMLASQATGFGHTMKDKILNGSEHVLSDGTRRLSRELVAELKKLGVVVQGQDPAGYLATYLSKEKSRFTSDQKAGGWTLTRLVAKGRSESAGTLSDPVSTPRLLLSSPNSQG